MNVILISDSPPVGWGWVCIFLLPLAPVGFREVSADDLMEYDKVFRCSFPQFCIGNLRIAMNQHVAHTNDLFPRQLYVRFFEFACEHISCLADNLDIFHDGIVTHTVCHEILITDSFDKLQSIGRMFEHIL